MTDEEERADTPPPWTMSVPKAGRRYYGAGKNRSYDLARTGIMPTIKTGPRTIRALPRVIENQLKGGK
jgi:hypothetical protein